MWRRQCSRRNSVRIDHKTGILFSVESKIVGHLKIAFEHSFVPASSVVKVNTVFKILELVSENFLIFWLGPFIYGEDSFEFQSYHDNNLNL